MSTEYGRIGTEVAQSFRNNNGIFTPKDIYELDAENKWTNFGQLELIQTQSASNVNALDFTSIQESTYNIHFITVTNFQATGSSTGGKIELFESGVIETGSVYHYYYQERDNGTGADTENRSTSSTGTGIDYDFDPATPRNNYFYLYNAGDSTKYTFYNFMYTGMNNGGHVYKFGGGVLPQASVVDGFRIQSSNTNNINIDSVSLYGIRTF
ncbi:hypothetical protein [Phenylobacterium sp.]|jgi:hypothetical protein|uniref:hypothetical protein n=1 Tax=Phenylobacterium sp. TaxID=1871053 RepID=UPI0025D759EF|nr:hypothetical protein [Phenylobacterium sp.]